MAEALASGKGRFGHYSSAVALMIDSCCLWLFYCIAGSYLLTLTTDWNCSVVVVVVVVGGGVAVGSNDVKLEEELVRA